MKKMLLWLAAGVLASCGADGGGGATEGAGAVIDVGITVPEMVAGRSAGTPVDAGVENFQAFAVIDANGTLRSAYSGAGANVGIEIPGPRAERIYVVANVGEQLSFADEEALKEYVADLDTQSGARWATGVGDMVSNFAQSSSDGRWHASAEVELDYIAARIVVNVDISGMDGYDAAANDGSLVLDRVAVLNARGQSLLFGESLIPTAYGNGMKYLEGLANGGFAHYPADDFALDEVPLSDNIAQADLADGEQAYHYYVFENDARTAAEFPTIVVLAGRYDGRAIYFPVHLSAADDWGATMPGFIERGKSYRVTIRLTGDPRMAVGGDFPGLTGGTDDPTVPFRSESVEAVAVVTDWDMVTMDKDM